MTITRPQVATALQQGLGPVADAAAHASGFTQRASKLTGARLVQTRVFGWLGRPAASVDRLSQTATRLGVPITRQGIAARFTPPAAACLEPVLAATVQTVLAAPPRAIPLLQRFPGGGWVQDSTTISLPGELAARWPGWGGSAGPTAALKLQGRHDLRHGTLAGPLLQPGRAQDRTRPHQTTPRPPEALRLADLGFFCLAELRRRRAAGSYWLTRLQAGTAVCTADGRRWAWLDLLTHRDQVTLDEPVALGVDERLPARLLAVRVPQAVADQRRRRLRAEARPKGQPVSRERLALGGWTVLVTHVPPARLTLREALVLARARWPIDLRFKRWTRHHLVDEWRSQNPWRRLWEVDATLLGVVVHHWLRLVGGWHYPDHSLTKAALPIQAPSAALTAAFRHGATARVAAVLEAIAYDLAGACRLTRRQTRPATYHWLLAPGDVEAPEAAVAGSPAVAWAA